MACEWRQYDLGEVAEIRTGKLDSNQAVEGGGYPMRILQLSATTSGRMIISNLSSDRDRQAYLQPSPSLFRGISNLPRGRKGDLSATFCHGVASDLPRGAQKPMGCIRNYPQPERVVSATFRATSFFSRREDTAGG